MPNHYITSLPHSLHPRRIILVVSFLLSLFFALPMYPSSSFLARYVGEGKVGIVFTLSALASIVLLALAPVILRRLGNYRTFFLVTTIEVLGLLAIILFETPAAIVAAYGIYFTVATVLPFQLDIFLEKESTDTTTGSTRGSFLTAANIGVLVAPFLAGIVLGQNDFQLLFLATAALTLPLLLSVHYGFRHFVDPRYDQINITKALYAVVRQKNLMLICFSNFLLYFFYSWMVIYTPLYLNRYLGFSWSTIGVIFTVMLLPFVLFEIPLGRLADKRWGEKEIVVAGFAILAITTAALSFAAGATLFFWAYLLFLTRTGASAIEIGNETYFFKHVDSTDAHLISFYRMTRPIAYVVGPAIATLLLAGMDIRFLFVALGVIMLAGIPTALMLKDTK